MTSLGSTIELQQDSSQHHVVARVASDWDKKQQNPVVWKTQHKMLAGRHGSHVRMRHQVSGPSLVGGSTSVNVDHCPIHCTFLLRGTYTFDYKSILWRA